MSYLDLVDVMLNMLRTSREGDWSLHLLAVQDMVPWCFSYDKQDYARYLSHYYAEMIHLDIEHPETHRFLKNGGFFVTWVNKIHSVRFQLIRQSSLPNR